MADNRSAPRDACPACCGQGDIATPPRYRTSTTCSRCIGTGRRPRLGVIRRMHHGVAELYLTIGRVRFGVGWVVCRAPDAWFFAVNRERSWKCDRAVCVSVWRLRLGLKVLDGEAGTERSTAGAAPRLRRDRARSARASRWSRLLGDRRSEMGTTREDISGWFDRGVSEGARYMLVVCDSFHYEDYPVFAKTDDECLEAYRAPGEMQRVMEVYDLRSDKAEQMAERRAMHLPPNVKHNRAGSQARNN